MMDFLVGIVDYITDMFGHLSFADLIDVIFISFLIYQAIRFTRRTRASQVFKGVVIILLAAWLINAFNMQAVGYIVNAVLLSGPLVLVILFQPELRRMLEQIGRKTALERTQPDDAEDAGAVIEAIASATLNLSRRKVGMLMVIEQRTGVHDVIQTGTLIDSLISAPLIENIFEPNTPLHDGAVIIQGRRAIAAGCVLPLTEDNMLSRELGTRHRAGLGITESSDAIALIVSEETGTISMARGGKLTRYLDGDAIRRVLAEIYEPEEVGAMLLPGLFKRRGKGER